MRRRTGIPDGQRHPQPHDPRNRQGATGTRQPLCRRLRSHALARGDRRGPLHGIPMTVKDHALWDEAESQVRN